MLGAVFATLSSLGLRVRGGQSSQLWSLIPFGAKHHLHPSFYARSHLSGNLSFSEEKSRRKLRGTRQLNSAVTPKLQCPSTGRLLFLLQTFVAFGATDLDLALKSQSSVDNFLFLFSLPVVLHIYKLNRLQVDLPFS